MKINPPQINRMPKLSTGKNARRNKLKKKETGTPYGGMDLKYISHYNIFSESFKDFLKKKFSTDLHTNQTKIGTRLK